MATYLVRKKLYMPLNTSGMIEGDSMKKILIVDDDDSIRECLTDALTGVGYKVITAKNGDEGLERLWEFPPDLVILDLMMPVMNGFEFKKIMDSHPDRAGIPVILFTSQPELALPGMNVAVVINKASSLNKILEMIKFYYLDHALPIETQRKKENGPSRASSSCGITSKILTDLL